MVKVMAAQLRPRRMNGCNHKYEYHSMSESESLEDADELENQSSNQSSGEREL
jgi:hypothetical protein